LANFLFGLRTLGFFPWGPAGGDFVFCLFGFWLRSDPEKNWRRARY
jgi:hypothetical protein